MKLSPSARRPFEVVVAEVGGSLLETLIGRGLAAVTSTLTKANSDRASPALSVEPGI